MAEQRVRARGVGGHRLNDLAALKAQPLRPVVHQQRFYDQLTAENAVDEGSRGIADLLEPKHVSAGDECVYTATKYLKG